MPIHFVFLQRFFYLSLMFVIPITRGTEFLLFDQLFFCNGETRIYNLKGPKMIRRHLLTLESAS